MIYDFDVINDADILCQKKLRASKSLLKTREDDLDALQEKVGSLKEIENIALRFSDLKEINKNKERLQREISETKDFYNALENQKKITEGLKRITKISIPSITNEESLLQNFIWISKTYDDLYTKIKHVKSLKNSTTINIPSTDNVEKDIQVFQEMVSFYDSLKRTLEGYDRHKKYIAYLTSVDFDSKIKELEKTEETIKETSFLENVLLKIKINKETINEVDSTATQITKEYTEALFDYNSYKSCPLCEQPLKNKTTLRVSI